MSDSVENMVIIQASEPEIIPATEEKVCNMWGVQSIYVGCLPNLPTTIELQKCHSDGTNITWSTQPPRHFDFPDLFAVARSRPRIQQAINLLMEELAEMMQEPAVPVPLPPLPEPSSSEPFPDESEVVEL